MFQDVYCNVLLCQAFSSSTFFAEIFHNRDLKQKCFLKNHTGYENMVLKKTVNIF